MENSSHLRTHWLDLAAGAVFVAGQKFFLSLSPPRARSKSGLVGAGQKTRMDFFEIEFSWGCFFT